MLGIRLYGTCNCRLSHNFMLNMAETLTILNGNLNSIYFYQVFDLLCVNNSYAHDVII